MGRQQSGVRQDEARMPDIFGEALNVIDHTDILPGLMSWDMVLAIVRPGIALNSSGA